MKNFLVLFICLLSFQLMAQEKGTVEAVIQTSAECGSCKERLEEKLNYTKGVKYAELDLHTMKLTVGYSPKKISLDEIKTTISELGYDADDVKANQQALKQLPSCCQPGGMGGEH